MSCGSDLSFHLEQHRRYLPKLAPCKNPICVNNLAESTEAPETLLVKGEILMDFAVISTKGLKTALSQSFLTLGIKSYNCFQLVTRVLQALLFLDVLL